MSRILLADDSPHAQRMGERILREEGFEVVSLTDGNAAMLRLADVDPDLILADVFLPGKSGFELCRHVKSEPRFKHVRVVLTAGLLEPFDEDEAKRAGCDAILKKPFEASKVVSTIDPLVKEAQLARGQFVEPIVSVAPVAEPEPEPPKPVEPPMLAEPPTPPAPEIDPERVRAAVTLALDAALPALIQEITERVLIALGH
jgi:CheY-like chemotaxis protein